MQQDFTPYKWTRKTCQNGWKTTTTHSWISMPLGVCGPSSLSLFGRHLQKASLPKTFLSALLKWTAAPTLNHAQSRESWFVRYRPYISVSNLTLDRTHYLISYADDSLLRQAFPSRRLFKKNVPQTHDTASSMMVYLTTKLVNASNFVLSSLLRFHQPKSSSTMHCGA